MRKYIDPNELKKSTSSGAPSSSPGSSAGRRRTVVDLNATYKPSAPRPATKSALPSKQEDPPTAEIPAKSVAAPQPPPQAIEPAGAVEAAEGDVVMDESESAAAAAASEPAPKLPKDRTQIITEEDLRGTGGDQASSVSSDHSTTISGEYNPSVQGIPKIPTSSSSYKPASPIPLGKEAKDYLDLHLPMNQQLLTAKLHDKLLRLQSKSAEYTTGEILARGAECILYNGRISGENFCVKSIRNWKDKFLGNPRTRKDEGKLGKTSYSTKLRHLNNEFQIGTMIQTPEIVQTPVHIYGLRQIKKFGLELGWDLLMERIYGIDLSDRGLLKALTLSEKVSVCILICQAIDMLHQRHIIHLDIKPSNFMLERSGRVRLIDFGISVQAGSHTKGVAGTAGYFSPEQLARGELSEVTDIFALGITFSIICGAKPLSQSAKEALNKAARSEASHSMKDNGSAIADIPELTQAKPLADVIRACSSYKREKRPSSCRTIVKQLRSAAAKCGLTLPI